MTTIVPIVEGDGEVGALPILLRRLCAWLTPEAYVEVAAPLRVRRDRFLNRQLEFERMLMLAALKAGADGWILIVLDADDDCPVQMSAEVRLRAQAVTPHRRVSVVLANREYEAWFVAAAASLDAKHGFAYAAYDMRLADTIRGAKEWMNERIVGGKYREVIHQAKFSALMDLPLARDNSRSFRKLCDEWYRNMSIAPRIQP